MQNRSRRPFSFPSFTSAREILGQFAETREHLIRARNELLLALRSALDTVIEKGNTNGKNKNGESGDIRKLNIE